MKSKRKEEKMEMIKGANVLTYEGHVVYPYNYSQVYRRNDYVEYEGMIFRSLTDFNLHNSPIGAIFRWEEVGRIINRRQHYEEDDVFIKDWEKDKNYTQYDKVKYKGHIYTCKAGNLEGSVPPLNLNGGQSAEVITMIPIKNLLQLK